MGGWGGGGHLIRLCGDEYSLLASEREQDTTRDLLVAASVQEARRFGQNCSYQDGSQ